MIPDLIDLPGGDFLMGDDAGRPDERPRHRVRLAPFRAAVRPVSVADYLRYVAVNGPSGERAPPPFLDDARFSDPEVPVVGVNWHEALAYCGWLAARTGLPVRLPSEAEREFATRGGLEGADWPWGATPPHERAPDVARLDRPHRPASQCANGYGLLCLADNVHEWCSDWYDPGYYAASALNDPSGPAGSVRRASRGGSWRHSLKFSRVSARSSLDPARRYNDYGFRLYADA